MNTEIGLSSLGAPATDILQETYEYVTSLDSMKTVGNCCKTLVKTSYGNMVVILK